MSTIWAFDLGKGSIGEAVWNTEKKQFDHVASLLIPAEFASTKEAATRRRMLRTRQAHKAREAWLDEVWKAAGLTPLVGRRVGKVEGKWQLIHEGDPRLEREFPAKGDSTCYTSCLLRIKLLRGEKLEEWQIYKALHSAIQKRGYDPNVAWKTREQKRSLKKDEENEEKGTLERMHAFEKELMGMAPDSDANRLPCYYDAWKMGLWNPALPEKLNERIDHDAGSKRKVIVPRSLVEREVRLLVDAAGKQISALQGKGDHVLYGPAGRAYASYYPELRLKHQLREGGTNDWHGVLGQKIPRFDNRIIEKCVLIPRFNVCKVDVRLDKDGKPYPESLLASEVTFLMKLKNMRVQRAPKVQSGLTAQEIKSIFNDPKVKGYKLTASQWKKMCESFGAQPVNPKKDEVEPPKESGRSRFCRPALEVLKRLILSGETPKEFHAAEIVRLNGNTDEQKGLVAGDLKFLLDMGPTWEGLYVPNQKLDALAQQTTNSDAAIRLLIGSQNDPVVRHRLETFWNRLKALEEETGKRPDEIVIEFVRTDFMGRKAKLDYEDFMKKRAKERKEARADAEKAGATEKSAGLKMELLRLQGGRCLYTDAALLPTNLEQYEIEHIVPRSRGGPDAMVNYVLTTKEANKEKGERTPFEWLSGTDHWDGYRTRVTALQTALRNKKVLLLLSEDAVELAEKYTALAETAWIAKLSQTLAGLHFGWKNGIDAEGRRRVTVISGGLTGRIRRKYRLNSLLAGDDVSEEEAEEKNRSDDRHHALDAMVLALLPGWARDKNKTNWFKFPDGVNREFFARQIQRVQPVNECLSSAALEQTAYGEREIKNLRFGVGREPLTSLLIKVNNGKETMKAPDKAETNRIVEPAIRREVKAYLQANPSLSIQDWKQWCENYRVGGKGARVFKLLMTKTKPDALDEYQDVSKDGTKQLRRGEMHRGYFVYWAPAPTKKDPDKQQAKVRPVYAFESVARVMRELKQQGSKGAQFFQSGCTVEIENAVDHAKTPLGPGRYLLNSIWEQGNVVVTNSSGKVSAPIGLAHMLNAGLKRTN
jgi:CRISPR-associated endonuclease Csn1